MADRILLMMLTKRALQVLALFALGCFGPWCDAAQPAVEAPLPRPFEEYADPQGALLDVLQHRLSAEPFNGVALAIFLCAICHTFLTSKFRHLAHVAEEEHAARCRRQRPGDSDGDGQPDEVSFKGQLFHFLGEVEAVFGIWAVVLAGAIAYRFGWEGVTGYIGTAVNYTEPMFVVVIMAIAATRPVLRFAEASLRKVASLGGERVAAWWLAILTIAPVLGSFITEPAAMTIAALLLARQFYELKPSPRLAYATIGLLFVNISVGGTLTHFAAPPVLMVAAPWNWDTVFMLTNFGWKAVVGILVATGIYYVIFRRELAALEARRLPAEGEGQRASERVVPVWITAVHLVFLGYTVLTAHYPPLFMAGFLFFVAFHQATAHHQARLELKSPLLVGFFLAGLVVHGGLQGWWIEPVLKSLSETPLFVGATLLTALNDNAAITYLATLVPGFTEELKYAVVAGAVTGGGLTVIANAPNPAGQSILQRYFPEGVNPLGLLAGAIAPTVILAACFLLLWRTRACLRGERHNRAAALDYPDVQFSWRLSSGAWKSKRFVLWRHVARSGRRRAAWR
mgnify:CR=1 FL=1